MRTLTETLDRVEELAEELLTTGERVTAAALGLDQRACYGVWAMKPRYENDEDSWIAVSTRNRRMLDYYGGFEYVDQDQVIVLGSYVFYSGVDSRVADHLSHLD